MKLPVYDIQRNKVGEIEAPERMFGVAWKPTLVHQAIVAQEANARNAVAHAKDRSEVSGGGKKPWKQKGTGRARHGSIRSPLWVGGGVTHGPRNEKDYSQKINKKMKLTALFSVLSKKAGNEQLDVIDALSANKEVKTKALVGTLEKIAVPHGSVLIVLAKENKSLQAAARNLKKVSCVSPRSLNVRDLAKSKKIIFEKAALEEAIEHFVKL